MMPKRWQGGGRPLWHSPYSHGDECETAIKIIKKLHAGNEISKDAFEQLRNDIR